MSLNVQGPRGGPDLSRRNKRGLIYVTTDPTADNSLDPAPEGSIRFAFTPGDTEAHIEKFENGVWNDDSLRVGPSSLHIGRDMSLSDLAGFIQTINPSSITGHSRALILHIEFTEDGTPRFAHMPVADIKKTFMIFPGPATGEIVSTTISQSITDSPRRSLEKTIHEVGSISATAQIQVNFYKGTDNTGFLFNRFNIPAGDMVANQPLIINYNDNFGFEGGEPIFQEFKSSANISLKTNISGDIITSHEGNEMAERDMIADELVVTNDLSVVFDNNLGLLANNRFN